MAASAGPISKPTGRRAMPSLTIGISLCCFAIFIIPALTERLQFDRAAVLRGEVWRIFTGHLTHWSSQHLLWDVLTFAALGSIAEAAGRRWLGACLLTAAALIPPVVAWVHPDLNTYRGLSGIDSAVFALVLVDLAGRGGRVRTGAIAAGAALAAKIAYECVTGDTLFVDPRSATAGAFVPVPVAHAAGAAVGLLTGMIRPRTVSRRGERFQDHVHSRRCGDPGAAGTSERSGTLMNPIVDRTATVLGVGLLVAFTGCFSSGLSSRETGTRNVSSYLMSLYDVPQAQGAAAQPTTLALPIRAAVAQIGEVAPPEAVVAKLSAQPGVFARVEPIPGVFSGDGYVPPSAAYSGNNYNYNYSYNAPPAPAPQHATGDPSVREEMQKMRRLAVGMGLDYLVLVGGTIDSTTDSTRASLLDLTVIGAFVIDSKAINAEGRATAALIDLRTNRVVLTASAESRDHATAPTAAQGEGETNLLRAVRDDVLSKAAGQLALNCQNHAGMLVVAPGIAVDQADRGGPVIDDGGISPDRAVPRRQPPAGRPAAARPVAHETTVDDPFWK